VVQVVPPVDNGEVGAALSLIARVQLLVPVTAMVTGESISYSRNKVYQILVGKSQRKNVTWKDNTQMDFTQKKHPAK
jgi:hypothetical protein